MSRRRSAEKRSITKDPRFQDELIAKFVNVLMRDGKKSVARKILYGAMEKLESKEKGMPSIEVVKLAVENVQPVMEVRSRRIGGSTYQVPTEVRPQRRNALALRWIIQNAAARGGKSMEQKLTAELWDAFQKKGGAIRKKEDAHRMAESNRAFAHYRW